MIVGEGAYSKFKFESGVHRVQRVPETESQGRIHTSTVTVAVLPEAEDFEFELNMDELEITTHRSAGAGGQHVNKTESAIRIIHIPTGHGRRLSGRAQPGQEQGKGAQGDEKPPRRP